MRPGQARIGLLTARSSAYDTTLHPGVEQRMRTRTAALAAALDAHVDLTVPPTVVDEPTATAALDALRSAAVEAVVFAPLMAVNPALLRDTLSELGRPVVMWNALPIRTLPAGLTQADATELTSSVGAVMVSNALGRQGVPVTTVTGPVDDSGLVEELVRTATAVAAAGALAGATVLRLGDPVPGYVNVQTTRSDLDYLRLREHAPSLADWEAQVTAVDGPDAEGLLSALRARGWTGAGEDVLQSARVAVALERAMREHRALAGTVNCHGPYFRGNDTVAAPACLGVARLTEQGCPLACTGDLPTGILLYLARRIAGAALYCEIYAVDHERDGMLLVGGSEADPAWTRPDAEVQLRVNDYLPGPDARGVGLTFRPRTGPATLLSLVPHREGWRLVWTTGAAVGASSDRLRGPGLLFRVDGSTAAKTVSGWIDAGANHHSVLVPGDRSVEVRALATALQIETVPISWPPTDKEPA